MDPDVDLVIVHGAEATGRDADDGVGWAPRLALALNADLVDLAKSGSSNRRLVRKVVSQTTGIIRSRGVAPERVLTVLAWAEADRFEIQARRSLQSYVWRGGARSMHQLNRGRAAAGDPLSLAWYSIYDPKFGSTEFLLFLVLLERWLAGEGIRCVHQVGSSIEVPAGGTYDLYLNQVKEQALTDAEDGLRPIVGGDGQSDAVSQVVDRPDLRAALALTADPEGGSHRSRRAARGRRRSPVRLVVVNGDSNTWGDEHADPAATCWGSVLADRLGADVANMAERGGSNHRLLRTTVEHLGRIAGRRGVAPHEVLFIGMWTMTSRFEIIGDEPHRGTVREPGVRDPDWHRVAERCLVNDHLPCSVWYRDLDRDEQGKLDLLLWTILLDRWLEDFGCRHLMALAYDHVLPEKVGAVYPGLTAQLPEKSLVGGRQWSQMALRKMFADRSPHGKRGHLLEEGHQRYVDEVLLPWMRRAGVLG